MIAIDSEFQSLIPPLSDDEYERLEKSLTENGYQDWREPIITWNGTIIDGHNRYRICDEHGIKFRTMEIEFESRDAAKLWIVKNQLKRRNLPQAAIMDLKLNEKKLTAARARERQRAAGGDHGNQYTGGKTALAPNLAQAADSGRTLEILARDIGVGRESLRKMDVIKQRAEQGDPVAVKEREALISGKKKSIHGAYVAVVGKPKPRKPEESVTEDGRRICAMCGEPINDGEAHPARPTVHKKCELEYQKDWAREKRAAARVAYAEPTIGDTNEVLTHDKDELRDSLLLVVQDMGETLQATIRRYETMDVRLKRSEADRIIGSLGALTKTIESIGS